MASISAPTQSTSTFSQSTLSLSTSSTSGARGGKRRKHKRLTMAPKKKKPDEGVITKAKFQKLEPVDMLRLPGAPSPETRPLVFARGDDVTVNSVDDGSENLWTARILDIRTTPEQDDAYFRVSWYYSARDVVQSLLTLYQNGSGNRNPKPEHDALLGLTRHASPNERFLSNETRILQWQVMKEVVTVFHYNECDLDSTPEFTEHDFFMRHYFDAKTKLLIPPLSTSTCPICDESYVLFPSDSDATDTSSDSSDTGSDTPGRSTHHEHKTWHFCPKIGCRRWYHHSCLPPEASVSFIGPRPIRLLAVDPDAADPYPDLAQFTYTVPARGKHSAPSQWGEPPWDAVLRRLSHLPPALVRVAQQPIIKRPGEGKDSVCGNLKDVVLARRICYQALEGGTAHALEGADPLHSILFGAGSARSGLDSEDALRELSDLLVSTGVILASPYAPYWDRLLERGLEDDESFPPVRCPNCSSPV